MSNRLKDEKSPYLLQHKNNPVDWYPWCEAAFIKAKKEDKPILLSIGYSTCHWCHVMAHESFEDQQVAEILRDYVCIKVDREERPDIDAVYMNVCQALTGSGGWPLTILMTPEQKPFFAGTYLPKQSRYGHTGLIELLEQVNHLWHTDKERLLDAGEQITSVIAKNRESDQAELNRALLDEAYTLLRENYDAVWGGFGAAPKFPAPHTLLFLLRYFAHENKADARKMAERTLAAMAQGGIFDQIGGGFSRYSTDKKWLVPHFEKMLYDNALLILAYTEAFRLTKNNAYANVARETADYILRELTDKESGGFCCGQDADSDGVEGKYYLFTPEEIIRILGEKEGKQFCRHYHITEGGNFEGSSIPNRIGRQDDDRVDDAAQRKRLAEYRQERTFLHRDDKILLSWNAWTIVALARAGLVLDDEHYIEEALSTQRFIENKMIDSRNRLFLRFRDGDAAHSGQLEDYAVYALALLELYGVTFDTAFLRAAIFRARQMIDLFEDRINGGFFINADDAEQLIARPKETYDGAMPSGNSAAAMVLERLASLTGEIFWREAADRQHRFMAGQIQHYPAGYCFFLLAAARSLYPHRELICVSADKHLPPEFEVYLRNHPADEISVLFKSPENASALSAAAPFTQAYPIPPSGSLYYLCEDGSCREPVSAIRDLHL